MTDQNAQTGKEELPKHLIIVGWAFIFVGFLALIQTLYTLINLPLPDIDFLIIFIYVGFALLKKKPLWRKFAISCSMIVLIFLAGNLLFILTGYKSISAQPTSIQVIFWVKTIVGIGATAYALWALQSKDVRKAFE